jgi:hypothetical protein
MKCVRTKFWRSFTADDTQNAVKYLKAHLTTYTACLDVERLHFAYTGYLWVLRDFRINQQLFAYADLTDSTS